MRENLGVHIFQQLNIINIIMIHDNKKHLVWKKWKKKLVQNSYDIKTHYKESFCLCIYPLQNKYFDNDVSYILFIQKVEGVVFNRFFVVKHR